MPYLPETVASIQAQTFTDWEYIIVDDASQDETVSWVETASKGDSRIRLIRREQQAGPFVSANEGLRQARGVYIIRTDADDLQPPSRIASQLNFLSSHEQYCACITPWHSFNESGLIRNAITYIPSRPRVLRWFLLLHSCSSHSSLCINTESLKLMGGYRELPVAADYALVSKLSLTCKLGVLPEILSYVRRHKARISRSYGNLQFQIGTQIMGVHLEAISEVTWPDEYCSDLWLAGHAFPLSLTRGTAAINRWSSLWRKDQGLDAEDIRLLRLYEAYHSWKFLRANARRRPFGTALVACKLLSQTTRWRFYAPPEEYIHSNSEGLPENTRANR